MNFRITLFVFSLFLKNSDSFECPNGSVEIPSENVCFFAISTAEFYWDVYGKCAGLGAIPGKIRNIFENSFAFSMTQEFSGVPPFIGVERKQNGTWTYADGSPLTYQNWASNEPSGANLCAVMDPQTAKWRSADCSVARPFFCSTDEDNNKSTTPSKPSTIRVTTTTSSGVECRMGWHYNGKTSYCYYLQDFTYSDGIRWQMYNWTTAEARCQQMGAHLVSIHSNEENDFVYDLITSNVINQTNAVPDGVPCKYQFAWIGYFGTGEVPRGVWSDGSPVDYTGHSLSSLYSYYWGMANDASCDLKLWFYLYDPNVRARFVCKTPAASNTRIVTTTTPAVYPCIAGWYYSKETDNCYYLKNFTTRDAVSWVKHTWAEAESTCQSMSAHLVSIHSNEENDFVNRLIASNASNQISVMNPDPCDLQTPWIGLYGNGTLAVGRWSDGTPVDYIGYVKRSPPSSSLYWVMSNDQSCGYISWDFGCPDTTSCVAARFVCKMPSKNRREREKFEKGIERE